MIRSIQIKNFKAIADSGRIALTPLTVFVGHNGTGKSSVLEALEFFHRYVQGGVDEAIAPWYDIDHILWQGHDREKPAKGDPFYPHPLEISLTGTQQRNWRTELRLGRLAQDTETHKARMIAPKLEAFVMASTGLWRREFGKPATSRPAGQKEVEEILLPPGRSILEGLQHDADRWMFLSLDPLAIGQPRVRRGSGYDTTLNRSGAI